MTVVCGLRANWFIVPYSTRKKYQGKFFFGGDDFVLVETSKSKLKRWWNMMFCPFVFFSSDFLFSKLKIPATLFFFLKKGVFYGLKFHCWVFWDPFQIINHNSVVTWFASKEAEVGNRDPPRNWPENLQVEKKYPCGNKYIPPLFPKGTFESMMI